MDTIESSAPKRPEPSKSGGRGAVKAASSGLCRDLELLNALTTDEALTNGGLGVVRLAQIIGRDKSQVSRAMRALEQVNMVERDPQTREYRLGWQLFRLAARASHERLQQLAPHMMRTLVEELGESVHLCVLEGSHVLTVHTEAPKHHLRATGWVGRTIPGYCSSAGRVLLGDHTLEEIERRFRGVTFEPIGPAEIVHNVADLYQQVQIAREQGFALVREEVEAELVGVSAPIRDFRGVLIAALNMSAPKFRLDARLEEAGRLTAAATAQVSEALGWV